MSSRIFTQTIITRIASRTRAYPPSFLYARANFATQNENNQVKSKASELKDQVIGSIKENVGYIFGSKTLENEAKQQKESTNQVSSENPVRNRTDYDDVKPEKSTLDYITEKVTAAKDQVVAATKEDVNYVADKVAAVKDQVVGTAKDNLGSTADKAASVKDQVVGTVKENLGSASNKATSAKDQVVGAAKENLGSAADKAASIKDQVVGTVKESLSSAAGKATSIKDQVVGSAKENIGYVTGNSTLESEGKIQKNIATDKIPIDKQSIAEKAAIAKDQIVGKAKETVNNMSGNDAPAEDPKKRLPHSDRINAEKVSQKNSSSQKRNP